MPDKVYVKVRPGVTYGAYDEFKSGATLHVTKGELDAFPDKLVRVTSPSDVAPVTRPSEQLVQISWHGAALPDVRRYAVYSVIEFVKAGILTVNEAIAIERTRIPPRKTLIEQLMLLDVHGD